MDNERGFLGVWIPKDIYLHTGLTPTEKLLLAEITCLHGSGSCFASNQHFAEFLGISKSQVSRLITKLARMNLILVEIAYVDGTKEVDKRFLTPIGIDSHTPTHECVYPLRVDAYTPTNECVDPMRVDAYYKEQEKEQPKEQEKKKKINKKNVPNSEYEKEFATLWAMYPKKDGRKIALSSYIKARKVMKYTYETIKLGLERYIRHLEDSNEDYQYFKAGKTWFNSEGWNDEYAPPANLKRKPTFNEYIKQKHGGGNNEQVRDRKVVNLHTENLPEPFQGF